MTDPTRIGQFDPQLFERYRSSPEGGTRKRMLLGQLLVENEPLVKLLVSQLLGRGERRAGQRAARCPGTDAAGRMPGAELFAGEDGWEDAMQAGRIGLARALESLDLDKGRLSYHALRKIHYELQCLMAKTSVVRVDRGQEGNVHAVMASSYDDEAAGEGRAAEFAVIAHRARVEEHGEPPSHGDLVLASLEAERAAERGAQPAVEAFVRERLVFGAAARVPRVTLVGAFLHYAARTGTDATLVSLRATLRERGVGTTWMRVSWNPTPVRALRGVRVQSAVPQVW